MLVHIDDPAAVDPVDNGKIEYSFVDADGNVFQVIEVRPYCVIYVGIVFCGLRQLCCFFRCPIEVGKGGLQLLVQRHGRRKELDRCPFALLDPLVALSFVSELRLAGGLSYL